MADRISADQLIDDLTAVIRDAENLLRATAARSGDKVAEGERAPRSRCAKPKCGSRASKRRL